MEKFEFNYFQPKIQLFATILTQFYVNFHQNFNRNWWFAFEKCSNIFITNRSANGKIIINVSVNETVANNCLHKLSRSVGMLTENHDKRNRDGVYFRCELLQIIEHLKQVIDCRTLSIRRSSMQNSNRFTGKWPKSHLLSTLPNISTNYPTFAKLSLVLMRNLPKHPFPLNPFQHSVF